MWTFDKQAQWVGEVLEDVMRWRPWSSSSPIPARVPGWRPGRLRLLERLQDITRETVPRSRSDSSSPTSGPIREWSSQWVVRPGPTSMPEPLRCRLKRVLPAAGSTTRSDWPRGQPPRLACRGAGSAGLGPAIGRCCRRRPGSRTYCFLHLREKPCCLAINFQKVSTATLAPYQRSRARAGRQVRRSAWVYRILSVSHSFAPRMPSGSTGAAGRSPTPADLRGIALPRSTTPRIRLCKNYGKRQIFYGHSLLAPTKQDRPGRGNHHHCRERLELHPQLSYVRQTLPPSLILPA